MTRKVGVGRASASDGASWELNGSAPDALCYVGVRGSGSHPFCVLWHPWMGAGGGGLTTAPGPPSSPVTSSTCFRLQSLLFGPCLSSENKNALPSQPPGTVVRLKTYGELEKEPHPFMTLKMRVSPSYTKRTEVKG